ncbi:MAG: hypothetical protein FWG65_07165, partial [Turicibacter sp.]|nr:hypothetical protein [Turicibacter sp.]
LTITEYILGVFPEPSWNSAWRYVCKRDFILENGLFFAPTMYCEDMKWVLELLGKLEETAGKLAFLPEPFYAYNYRRTGSIMNSTSPKRILDLTTIIAEMLPKYRERPIVCWELIWQVFYYINEYCTFTWTERRLIFQKYQKILPMFGLAEIRFYAIIGKISNKTLFYWLSVAMFIGNTIKRILKKGANHGQNLRCRLGLYRTPNRSNACGKRRASGRRGQRQRPVGKIARRQNHF